MLYIVATPIGNLEDISQRALRVLREVNAIGAEDTRHTRGLLTHFDIHTPLFSFHQHNERQRTDEIVTRLRAGEHIAIVSDAGMPLVSDAGESLVARVRAEGLACTCIPGPTAVETALVLSGLPTDRFQFLGFVPRERSDRTELWPVLQRATATTVLYESPQRLVAFLREAHEHLPSRTFVVARELTKMHEEVRSGTADALATHYEAEGIRGECVVLVAPAEPAARPTISGDAAAMVHTVRTLGNLPHATAAKIVAALTGKPRQEVYAASIQEEA